MMEDKTGLIGTSISIEFESQCFCTGVRLLWFVTVSCCMGKERKVHIIALSSC